MRKPDSDFFFEREVYDLLTNGILKDIGENFSRDDLRREALQAETPEPNYFESLARRFGDHVSPNS